MDDIPDPANYPALTAKEADEIARGLQSLAQSLANGGMTREAERYRRGSLLWMQRSMKPASDSRVEIESLRASMDAHFARMEAPTHRHS